MKTLYNFSTVSIDIETLELKERTPSTRHVFFQFQVFFCCILFLFSFSESFAQNAFVSKDKQIDIPEENVIKTAWQPKELTAKTSFASALGLSQSHNGGIGKAPISPVVWVNGNAHAQNSHYVEGNSILYRVVLDDVPSGTHKIRLKWDIKHGGKHALDYITSYNRDPAAGGIAEVVNPLSDLPAGIFSTPNYFAIPTPAAAMMVAGKPQPTTSFLSLPAADRRMAAFNATITNITYLYEGNINDANATTEIEITYVVAGGPQFVLFSWGGHIASRLDWGPGNSASYINGSPYHTALGISDHCNGAQDRSLKVDAVQFFPSCDITPISVVCANDTISLTASTDAPSPQFTWQATNGAIIIGTGSTVQVVVPASGSFSVSVTIVDFFGGQIISESTTCSVNGSIKQDPVVSAGVDQSQCLGISGRDFQVTGSVSFGAFEWIVVSGIAVIDSENSLTTMVHLDPLSDDVVLRLQAIGSCEVQSDDLELHVNIAPEVNINTVDEPNCDDSSGEYSVLFNQDYAIQWSVSGNAQINGSSTGSSVTVIVDDLCAVNYTLSVSVTDPSGCIGHDSMGVSLSDSVAPIISSGPGANATITCHVAPVFTAPTAIDNCDASPVIHQLADVQVNGNCHDTYSVTRSWYFTDACGNVSDTVSQTINVVDEVAPVITTGPGVDATILCSETPVFTAPTASDNCCAIVTINQLADVQVNGNCPAAYSVTRSWYFTDDCGNISDTVSQTINVIDEVAPVISSGPGANATIACHVTPVFTAPTAVDNCDASPVIYQLADVQVNGNCHDTYSVTRSWYFTDACGNVSDTVSQTINVVDTVAPVITAGPGADATILCSETPVFTAPTAIDNCCHIVEIHQLADVQVNGNCPAAYSVTRSWYFTDLCGNISDTVSQTINVIDELAPVITSGPGADATIACTATPVFTAPTASDNCDASPAIHQLADVMVNGNCPSAYSVTRSWYFTDLCGNISDTVSQTINVIDELAPVITSGPGADATIACSATPVFTAPTASDNCCAIVTIHQLADVMVNGNCPAAYSVTRSWYFTDLCGNISDTVSQTINLIDAIAPVITVGPGANATIACSATPVFTAPIAVDNCDASPAIHQLADVQVNGSCPSAYSVTRSWYFTDACGNTSNTVSQTINVVDEVAPVINSGPGANATIACPGTPVFTAPTAVDNCDASPAIHQLADVMVNGNCAAEYSVTRSWYFTDACGNVSDTVSQTINVIDTVAPVIIAGPGADTTILCGDTPVFTPPTAFDICCAIVDMHQLADETIISSIPGEYSVTRSWYFTDACGNASDTVSQTIYIVNHIFGKLTVEEISSVGMNYTVFPNPFSQSTTIQFTVENDADVRIEIFSVNGDFISTLFDEKADGQREYQVILDGSMLSNGMYFCRIYSNNEVFESRIILNK